MRKTVECSVYECDGCGTLLGAGESVCYVDEDIWAVCADECGWKEIDGGHYCPDCWEIDDDDREVPKRQINQTSNEVQNMQDNPRL